MKIAKAVLFCWLVFFSSSIVSAEALTEDQQKRNSLISHMLSKQLPGLHYSDKELDDELATAAFGLYIKQLDYQKRFLLQGDVDELANLTDSMDENLKDGRIVLPRMGHEILGIRIAQVKKIVAGLIAKGLDQEIGDVYESDPLKLDYVKDASGLSNRWRKILKAQIMSRYLDLEEDALAADEKVDSQKMWKEATEKVAKQNKAFLHRLNQETEQDHIDRYFNAVTRAFGPHTNYIPPATKEQFDISMRGSLEGIGALLREEDGLIKVVRIIPGSASARQGDLEAEDTILSVGQGSEEAVDISDMRLRDAVRLIRGAKGTEVRLTVRKSDGVKAVVPIIRDVVQIEDTFVKSFVVEEDGLRLGYINIPSFYRDFEKAQNGGDGRNSTADTRAEILSLKEQNIDGIVLDLRNNGGGALIDAVDIAGLFVKEGPVVQIKTSMGDKRVLYDQDATIAYDGPMVVLVNKFSASASEIVAAALQDYGRAVVMGGTHTHGKGSVQTVLDLNEYVPWLSLTNYDDLGALKIMIQKFYRVNGGSTQYKGVEPDIVLPSLYEHLKTGEKYLEYSLPWDSIEAVEYAPYPKKLNLEKLSAQSSARVNKNDSFQTIKEESAKADKRSEETIVQLNLDFLRNERLVAKETRERLKNKDTGFGDEKELADDEEKTKEEKEKYWRKHVKADPWVEEAGKVIHDIIKDA